MAKYYTVTATLPNGKRKYYRGKTRREAEEKREKDLIAIGKGIRIGDKTTFEELARIWYEIKRDSNIRQVSIEAIERTMRIYVLPVLGPMRIVDIKPYNIRMLMHTLSGLSNSIHAKVRGVVKSVLDLAVENELIGVNPCLPTIKAGGKKTEEVVPLSDEQCRILLESLKGTEAWLFVMVLLYAGLRKGEALGLMWKDIDFKAGTLTVNRSIVYTSANKRGDINPEGKTKASHRTIPMVSVLSDALLEAHRKSRSMYVFPMKGGRYKTESAFNGMWDAIRRRSVFAKTEHGRLDRPITFHVHPHQLRHTCATSWVRSGMDIRQVMYLMGHSRMDVTLEIYSHYEEELRRDEARQKMEDHTLAV